MVMMMMMMMTMMTMITIILGITVILIALILGPSGSEALFVWRVSLKQPECSNMMFVIHAEGGSWACCVLRKEFGPCSRQAKRKPGAFVSLSYLSLSSLRLTFAL